MNKYVKDYEKMLDSASIEFGRTELLHPEINMPPLVGNGNFGGNIDRFGMMNSPLELPRCYIWHKKHVEIGRSNLECRVPLLLTRYRFLIGGAELAIDADHVEDYSQRTELACGCIITKYTLNDGAKPVLKLELTEYCSLAEGWLMQCEFRVTPLTSGISLIFEHEMQEDAISQNGVPMSCPIRANGVRCRPTLRSLSTRGCASLMLTSPEREAELDGHRLTLSFECNSEATHTAQTILTTTRDKITLAVALSKLISMSPEAHRKLHTDAWAGFWAKSAVDMGDALLNGVRLRFMYALRCSEGSEENDVPLSPGGISNSDLWPFEFPQDYLWMYESYFTSNHLEMAGATSKYWLTILDQARVFTEDYIGAKGAFYAWTPSSYDLSDMLKLPENPPYSWQLHNGAYPLHMIWLYYNYTKDEAYLTEMMPVVRAIAEFYTSLSTYEERYGKYCIRFRPCMGQDEFGGFRRDNYLCCMLSAAWSIRAALELCRASGEAPASEWLDIEDKGYAFDLLKNNGMLATYEGGPAPNPAQKHPSQLNIIATLPLPELYASPEFKETYLRRYEISVQAPQNFFTGWSLGTFMIASARMRIPEEIERDLEMLRTNSKAYSPQFDPDYIQMYETGGYDSNGGYFHTAMSMMITATSEFFLQSFDGSCTVFPVILGKGRVAFDGLLSPEGIEVSGEYEDGCAEITLDVKRNTAVKLRLGEAISGRYSLVKLNGDIVAESDSREFDVVLDIGSYIIHKA